MSLAQFILAKAATSNLKKANHVRRNIKDMHGDDLAAHRREFIRKYHDKKPVSVIAYRLGMTSAEVRDLAKKEFGISLVTVKFWNRDRVEKLRKLAGTMTKKRIVQEMGCTIYGLEKTASEHGISLAYDSKTLALDDHKREQIIKMHKKGLGYKEIGSKIGVSYTTVKNFAKSQGLPMRIITNWKRSDLIIMCHAIEDGMKARHVGHYLGRSTMAVLRKAGLVRDKDPKTWAMLKQQNPLASREEIEAKYIADFGKL